MNITIRDGEEFIRLGQALKKAGAVGSGSDAKMVILNKEVKVNRLQKKRRFCFWMTCCRNWTAKGRIFC